MALLVSALIPSLIIGFWRAHSRDGLFTIGSQMDLEWKRAESGNEGV